MQLLPLQKSTAQAIVNIFETGSIRGNYADVTLMAGDTGELTYGRSQTTLASGNLYLLVNDYCARADGTYSSELAPYLAQLQTRNSALNHDSQFRLLLHEAGADPVMREVQDIFFDRVYWAPAMRSADALGVQSPLGGAIVYDSTVHGSWAAMRDATRKKYGELSDIGEKTWMARYLGVRRDWLANHPNALLHKTVYRMDALKAIVDASNWDLKLAMLVRGLQITAQSLGDPAPLKVAAEGAPVRLLWLTSPPMTGADVEWLQQRLPRAGFAVPASGAFDEDTAGAVRRFQAANGLQIDGVVGPATRAGLEDITVTAPANVAAQDVPMPSVQTQNTNSVALSPQPVTDHTAQPAHDTHAEPVHRPAPRTAPAHAPLPAAHAVQPDSDAVVDLKKHITQAVQSGIQSVRNDNNKLVQVLTSALKGGNVSGLLALMNSNTASDAQTMLKKLASNGRPLLATLVSGIVLSITESRDWLTWGESAPQFVKNGIPSLVKYLPNSWTQINATVIATYQSLHNLAAQLPPDWAFRLRATAIALIGYAGYRMVMRRIQANKLVKELTGTKN